MNIQLDGKTVLVSGGSSGIGEACVRLFRESGADLYFTAKNSLENAAKIENETGAHCIKCDISKEKECEKLVKKVVSSSGKIDVLVNNAGIYMGSSLGSAGYLEAWRETMNVNLDSCVFLSHFAVPFMKEAGGGKIVNISSIHALEGTRDASPYHSSKSGMDGLTRSLAVELAPFNIQVNSVNPGAIRTPIWGNSEDHMRQIAEMVPARRFGKPEEIAYATLFLSSQFANYITGHSLVVDGGTLVNVFKQ